MQANDNPYTSPKALDNLSYPPTSTAELDFERRQAKNQTRIPALGMQACAIVGYSAQFQAMGAMAFLGLSGIDSVVLRHVVDYWYLYAMAFIVNLSVAFLGSLTLGHCRNPSFSKLACIVSSLPVLSPLFPIGVLFAVSGFYALKTPVVRAEQHRFLLGEQTPRTQALGRLFWPAAFLLLGEVITLNALALPFITDIAFYALGNSRMAELHLAAIARGEFIRPLIMTSGGLVVGYGAIQMLRGRQYRACLVGVIVAMFPMLTPCIFLGIPFGIWAFVLLMRKDTRAAFAQVKSSP